jgi:hypothetical protein
VWGGGERGEGRGGGGGRKGGRTVRGVLGRGGEGSMTVSKDNFVAVTHRHAGCGLDIRAHWRQHLDSFAEGEEVFATGTNSQKLTKGEFWSGFRSLVHILTKK